MTYSISPLPWPHGIEKSPSNAHFRIPSEVLRHPGTFHGLFYEYFESGHTCTVGKYSDAENDSFISKIFSLVTGHI